MTEIILSGCLGRMGRKIAEICGGGCEYAVAAGVDPKADEYKGGLSFPVCSSFSEVIAPKNAVIVDFSHHSAVDGILDYAVAGKIPAVLCTTGYTDDELKLIAEASKSIPVFRSGNMSLGINLLCELCKRAAKTLGADFDIEIIEKHHSQKLDAPSGTALMLAEAMSETLPYEPEYVYDRHSVRQVRGKEEIGIHSVRGGTIVGEHEVIFAGPDEVITLSHSAQSRDVFARGALRAAAFLSAKTEPGMYSMSDIINQLKENDGRTD